MDTGVIADDIENRFTITTLGEDLIICDLFSQVAEEITIDGQSKDEHSKDEQHDAKSGILETFENTNLIPETICDGNNFTLHLPPLDENNTTVGHVEEEIIVDEQTGENIVVQVQYVDGNFLETDQIADEEVSKKLLNPLEQLPSLKQIIETDEQEPHVARDEESGSYQRSFEKHVNSFQPKNGKAFKCRQCNLQFPTLLGLSNHCKTVHNLITRRHGCEFCSKSFIWLCDLKRHTKLCPQNNKTTQQQIPQQETTKTNPNKKCLQKPYICNYCNKSFSYRSQLKLHLKKHTADPNKQQFNCIYCNKSFDYSSQLEIHLRKHTGQAPKKEFVCNHCNKSFGYNSHLKLHMGIHTGEYPKKQFNCNLCTKSFGYKSHLEIHLRRHTGEGPKKEFKCDYCAKTFGYNSHLLLHLKKHTGGQHKKQFNCNICEKTFGYRSHLDAHQRIHTNERPYSCTSCEKNFKTKSDLIGHQTSHTEDRPFVCSLCKTGYKTKQILKLHLKKCNSKQQHKCKDCDATFSKRTDLASHRKTHTKPPKKEHACEFCFKNFDHMFQLKLHLGIHTGERNFLCTTCQLAFKSLKNLTSHQKTHTKVEYLCEKCSRIYTNSKSLSKHMKSHEGQSYLCEICSRTYGSMGNLMKHKRLCHLQQPPPKVYNRKPKIKNENSSINLNESKTDLLEKANDCNNDLLNESNDCINDILKQINNDTNKDKEVIKTDLFNCEECLRTFGTKKSLLRHCTATHSDERPFSCPVCKESFKFKSTLRKHKTTHLKVYTEKHRYKCSYCDKAFVERRHWRNHERKHIDPQWKRILGKKIHTCEICSMKFADYDHLQRHLKTHTAERPYSCGICQKAYIKNTHLNRHLAVTHTREEVHAFKQELAKIRHKCEVCNKSFRCISHLKRHLSVHTKGPPSPPPNLNNLTKKHTCQICTKSFNSFYHLCRHSKVHRRERRFPCGLCDKTYTDISILNRHLSRHHSKEEVNAYQEQLKNIRYCCKFCKKNFKQEFLLKYHQRRHLELKRNSGAKQVALQKTKICKICSKSFERLNKLTLHLRRLHQTERNRVQKSPKSTQCDVCKKVCESHLSRVMHIQIVHSKSKIENHSGKQTNIAKVYENMVYALVNSEDLDFETEVYPKNDQQNDKSKVNENNMSSLDYHRENLMDFNLESEVKDIEPKNGQQIDDSIAKDCKENSIDFKFARKVNDINPIYGQQNHNLNAEDCKKNPINSNFETKENYVNPKNEKQNDILKNLDECVITALPDCKIVLIPIDLQHDDMSNVNGNVGSTNLLNSTFITKVNEIEQKCGKRDDILIDNNTIAALNDIENVKQHDLKSTLVECKENLIDLNPITAINDVDPLKVECNENQNSSCHNNDAKDKSVIIVENFDDSERLEDNNEEVICKEKIDAEQKPSFTCDLCKKVYTMKCSFYKHLTKSHTEKEVNALKKEMRNRCRFCGKRFASIYHYKEHFKSHNKERRFSCSLCNKAFFQKYQLNRHLKIFHIDKSRVSCHLCERSYLNKSNLNMHLKTYHNKKSRISCKFCEKTFSNNWNLNRHITVVHKREKENNAEKEEVSNKGYICCKYCNKGFNTMTHYKRHLKLHENSANFQKDNNLATKKLNSSLNSNCNSFDGLKKFTIRLRRVQQTQQNSEELPLDKEANKNQSLCSDLNPKTSLESLKDSENFIDDNEQLLEINDNRKEQSYGNYPCSICGILFKDKRCLSNHQRIHVKTPTKNFRGESKKYICKICSMQFAKSISYKKHLNLHSSERPYPCALCDKAYLQKAHLKRHLVGSHSKAEVDALDQNLTEKQQSFKSISQMERHRRTHSEKQLYSCNLCTRNFKYEFLLKYHYKIKHLKQQVRLKRKKKICKICLKSFDRAYKLTRHLRRLHQTQRNSLNYRAVMYDLTPVPMVNNLDNINDSADDVKDNAEDIFRLENSDNLNQTSRAHVDYILDHLNNTNIIDLSKTDNIVVHTIKDTHTDLYAIDVINNLNNRIEETYTYQYLANNDEVKDPTITNEHILKDSIQILDVTHEMAIPENTDEIKEELHTELEIKDEPLEGDLTPWNGLHDVGMNSPSLVRRKTCAEEIPTPQQPKIRIENVYYNYKKDNEQTLQTSKQDQAKDIPIPQEPENLKYQSIDISTPHLPEIGIQHVFYNYKNDKEQTLQSPQQDPAKDIPIPPEPEIQQDQVKEILTPQQSNIRIENVYSNYEKDTFFESPKEIPKLKELKIRIKNILYNSARNKDNSFALPKQDYIKENATLQDLQTVDHNYENDRDKAAASSINLEWRPTLDTDQQPYYCTLCKLNFKSKFLLMCHQKKHSQGQTIDCNQKRVSKQKRICRYCLKFFDGINNLNNHIRRTHQKKPNDVKKPPLPDNNSNTSDKPQLVLKSIDQNDQLNNELQMEISNDKLSVKDDANHSNINESQQVLNPEEKLNILKTNDKLTVKDNSKHTNKNDSQLILNQEDKNNTIKTSVCKVCSKSFASSFNLIRHLRIHTGERPYSCSMCKKSYSQKRNMIKHEKSHFKNCEEDLIELTPVVAEEDLDPLTVKTKENHKLADTDKVKDQSVTFLKNSKDVQNSGDSPDEIIPILKNSNTDEVENVKLNTKKENPNTCRICSKAFNNILSLRGHLSRHATPKPFVCSVCGKRFREQPNCTNHEKWCLKKKNYLNSNCLENSKNAKRIRKIYDCTVCSKQFAKYKNFQHHLYSHSKKKSYICYLCGKDFQYKIQYKSHQELHSLNRYMSSLEVKLKLNETKVATVCEENHINSITAINVLNFKDDVDLNYLENVEDIPSYAAEEIISSEYAGTTIEDIYSLSYIINTIEMDMSKTENISKYLEDNIAEIYFQLTNENDDNAESPPYKCCLCKEVFNSVQDLQIHLKKFNSQICDTYCKLCCKSFLSKDIFESHLNQHTDGHPYQCKLCEITFKDAQDLNNHQEIHLKKTSYCQHQKEQKIPILRFDLKCGVCDKIFLFQRNLIKHVQQLHCNENGFKCLDCSGKFSTITALLNHVEIHKPLIKKPACELCLQNIDKDHLYYSKTLKKDFNIYTCEVCGKSYNSSTTFKRHLRCHFTERPYSCTMCDKSYKTFSQLQEHRKRIHSNIKRTRKIACKLCSKSFYTVFALKCHIRTHSRERPFKCSLCEKSFGSLGWLKKHKIMHLKVQSGELPYYCDTCVRAFKDESSWLKHQEYHNVKCSLCKEIFKTNTALKKHQKIHIREQKRNRLYCCTICGKNYRNYRNWIMHQNIHAEHESKDPENETISTKCYKLKERKREHRYCCTICGKNYKNHLSWIRHQKMHSVQGSSDSENKTKCFETNDELLCDLEYAKDFDQQKMHSEQGSNDLENKNIRTKCYEFKGRKRKSLYSCTVCGKNYRNNLSWIRHQKMHSEQESKDPENKTDVTKCFETNDVLLYDLEYPKDFDHQKIYSEQENKTIRTKCYEFKERKRNLHCCTICGKNYKNYRSWISHQKMHSEQNSNAAENHIDVTKYFATTDELIYEYPEDFDQQEVYGHNQISTNDYDIICDLNINPITNYCNNEIQFSANDNINLEPITINNSTEIHFSNSPCSFLDFQSEEVVDFENSPTITDNLLPTKIDVPDVKNIKCVIQISKNDVLNNESIIQFPKNVEDNWSGMQQKSILHDHSYMTNKCALCKKEFDCQLDLLEHVQNTHPNFKGFKCRDCCVVLPNFELFLEHMSDHKEAAI